MFINKICGVIISSVRASDENFSWQISSHRNIIWYTYMYIYTYHSAYSTWNSDIYMYVCIRLTFPPIFQSLVVLEYLIKTGSERVSQQCKDNLFSIQTLKDFQYIDKDGKDQGANSECSRAQLVCLIIGVPEAHKSCCRFATILLTLKEGYIGSNKLATQSRD